jgi:hypothetical protein
VPGTWRKHITPRYVAAKLTGHKATFRADAVASQRVRGDAGLIDVRLHDLRRTLRTGLAELGVSFEIAERVLNHAMPGLQAVYNRHSYAVEKTISCCTAIGCLPLSVNTIGPIRGSARSGSTTGAVSGRSNARPLLLRLGGTRHTPASRSSSDQRRAPLSTTTRK